MLHLLLPLVLETINGACKISISMTGVSLMLHGYGQMCRLCCMAMACEFTIVNLHHFMNCFLNGVKLKMWKIDAMETNTLGRE